MADSQTNLKNFYEKISAEDLATLEKRSGLVHCRDLQLLRADFEQLLDSGEKAPVLEIGAGAGRVIRWFRRNFPSLGIHALEQYAPYAERLRNSFSGDPQVTLFEESLHRWEPRETYAFALWMWCSFNEQSPDEQSFALAKLRRALPPGGILFIDVPRWHPDYADIWYPQGLPPEGTPKIQKFEFRTGIIDCHYFTDGEMRTMAERAGFASVQAIPHEPTHGLGHVLYRLKA